MNHENKNDMKDKDENKNLSNKKPNTSEEPFGYDLYPERRGQYREKSWWYNFIHFKTPDLYHRVRCEKNVLKCVDNSPIVKLMMAALKSAGCPVDIRRHITCEVCDGAVTGGYDPELNQIVVCQNTCNKSLVQGVLAHEMIHMFDYCTNELDFKNLDHLACTEIRAANLAHCSFLSAWIQGHASLFNVQGQHYKCVRDKAIASVLAVRRVTEEEATAAVDRVFARCYTDLEPLGRRIRRNSNDQQWAYEDGPYYGYKL